MVITTVLDTRRPNKEGLYPVKTRVSHKSKANYYPTGRYISKPDFELMYSAKAPAHLIELLDFFRKCELRVREAVSKADTFDKDIVKSLLLVPLAVDSYPKENNVLVWFEYKAVQCTMKEAYGSATEYRSAAKFYKSYFKLERIPFTEFTSDKLREIQKRSVQYSISTVGKYARHLRSVFNLAIGAGYLTKELYPFGVNKYVPPTARKRKHALSREALIAFLQYKPVSHREQFHKDLFFFSFFGNGLNIKDVALLRYRDMDKYQIVKRREKTSGSSQEPICIKLMPQLIEIIERSGSTVHPDNYIFPLLDPKWDNARIHRELNRLRSKISTTLTGIARKLGIDGNLPHGTSRHCFANALKQSGAPMELISEMIGHSSVAVTKHYTSTFEELTYQKYLLEYTSK